MCPFSSLQLSKNHWQGIMWFAKLLESPRRVIVFTFRIVKKYLVEMLFFSFTLVFSSNICRSLGFWCTFSSEFSVGWCTPNLLFWLCWSCNIVFILMSSNFFNLFFLRWIFCLGNKNKKIPWSDVCWVWQVLHMYNLLLQSIKTAVIVFNWRWLAYLDYCRYHHFIIRRCPWCNGYRRRKWTQRHEFKSWTRLISNHIALIPLGKVLIQLFSIQLWVNSRSDWVLQPWWGN